MDKFTRYIWHRYNSRRSDYVCFRIYGQCWSFLREYLFRRSVWILPRFWRCKCFRWLRKYILWFPWCLFGNFLRVYHIWSNTKGSWCSSFVDTRYFFSYRMYIWNHHSQTYSRRWELRTWSEQSKCKTSLFRKFRRRWSLRNHY